jgi:fatty acid desaturase
MSCEWQMNFTALGPALMCEPLYYSEDAYLGTVPFMYLSPATRTRHWAGRGLVFAWMFILPYALHGLAKGLFFSFIPYNLLGCLYFAFSQVSHLSETCFDRAPPSPDSTCGRPEWAAHQVVSACDYSTRSRLWGFLSIGLNNQIVHHLFPAVDPSHYPDLAPIVEATCADFGVKYTAHGSWVEAWCRHLQWVRVLNEVDPSTIIPAADPPRAMMPVKRCLARPEPPASAGLIVDHD